MVNMSLRLLVRSEYPFCHSLQALQVQRPSTTWSSPAAMFWYMTHLQYTALGPNEIMHSIVPSIPNLFADLARSHALGLWDERSDLDLLTTKPLVQLLQVHNAGLRRAGRGAQCRREDGRKRSDSPDDQHDESLNALPLRFHSFHWCRWCFIWSHAEFV